MAPGSSESDSIEGDVDITVHDRGGCLAGLQSLLECLDQDLDEEEDEDSYRQVMPHIHRVLLWIWTTTWKKKDRVLIANPTEACLALLTVNPDSSFKQPKGVTSLIAKFEYSMHLTFLWEISSQVKEGAAEEESAVCDALQPWFTEKTYSSFARLRSLQHVASSMAYDTMALLMR